MKLRTRLAMIICLVTLTSAFSQDKKGKWTPQDIINTEYLRSATFSPDNNMLVWTKRRGVKAKDRFVNDLYMTRLDSKKDGKFRTIRMTNGDDSDYAPFFSKDNEKVYFLSSRQKGNKLWALNIYGGEAEKVHEFKKGISNIQWTSDSTFAFTAGEGKSLYETNLEKKKDNVVVVEDSVHWQPSRVFQFDLKKKTITRLSNNKYPVASYSISKNGEWLIYNVTRSRHYAVDGSPKRKYYLKNTKTGEIKTILDGLQTPYGFQFTKDLSGFYFVAIQSSNPEWNGAGISLLYYYDLATGNYTKVDLQWDWAMGGGYNVLGQDVLVSLANGTTNKLAFYKKNGSSWTKSELDLGDKNEHISILAISDDYSKVTYDYSTAGQLPAYYTADLVVKNGKLSFEQEEELIKLNKKLQSKAITKHEVFKWKGYNGDEVDGILYYPENYEEGKKYPLMLSIHGGPAGTDRDRWSERWSTYPQILAQRGAFVLKPNYHGSSNHGQEFVESIKQNYYTPEIEDITKAIDILNKKGMIDMDKLGTMGWSNGAIITTMLTVRYPDMFKVACPGAGDVNWTSDYGTCQFGVTFDQSYFGGAPWDDVDGKTYNEAYIHYSPLFELEKVKTPTIIFHGSNDRAVPRDQGWEYYRALQQSGKTPVRFLWFPGQPHGLGKITHQLRKMNEELAWIDHYLFGKDDDKNEAFKKDSPLASLLKKDSLSHENGLYGQMVKGKLIPETVLVKKDSIAIGRFEVTNAQFKQFDKNHKYSGGNDNHPAVVTFQQAKNYLQWLNKHTKNQYRLPSEKEAKSLHKKAVKIAAGENTIKYWAGYDININDLAQFRKKLNEVQSSLLMKAGSFKSTKVGKAEIYDLGGNVAEYNLSGEVYGFSAYDYVDGAAGQNQKSESGKTGFRIVLEK